MPQKVAGVEVVLSANSTRLLTELERSRKEVTKLRKGVDRSANRIKYAFNKIRRAAQVVASAFIFVAGIRQLGRLAVSIEHAEDRMALMQARFKQFGRSADTLSDVYKLSQRLGVSIDETAASYTRLAVATQNLKVSQAEMLAVQENIVILARAGGTSMEELVGGMRQLSQGLASGRLQGEELRSVLENLPLVAMEIAKELGITIGQIRQFAAEGKITGDVVIRALKNIGIGLEDLPDTFAQQTQRMNTEWQLLLAAMGKELETSGLTKAIADIFRNARVGGLEDYSVFSYKETTLEIEKVEQALKELYALQAEGKIFKGARGVYGLIQDRKEDLDALKIRLQEIAALNDSILAKGGLVAGSMPDRTPAWLREYEPATYRKYLEIETKKLTAEMDKLMAEAGLEDDSWLQPIKYKMPRVAKESFDEMTEYAKQAARNMQDAFADFLFDPFEDGLKGMLKSFLDTIRRMLSNQLAKTFFETTGLGNFISNIGKRAMGGPMSAGSPYIVGERGPELVIPNQNSYVVPNGQFGGVSVVNNIDARGADEARIMRVMPGILERNKMETIASIVKMKNEGQI